MSRIWDRCLCGQRPYLNNPQHLLSSQRSDGEQQKSPRWFSHFWEVRCQTALNTQRNVRWSSTMFTRQTCPPARHKAFLLLPFADVIGRLLGEHPLLEHVVECMDSAQLQSLLLMKHFSFAHNNTGGDTRQKKKTPEATVPGGGISQRRAERGGSKLVPCAVHPG